ncbi:MAG: FAD-binding oxidoreductase [Spartobacteria bacterium]|nr:FAD-binding oxidoreductase [Spartobacteria bacterium]
MILTKKKQWITLISAFAVVAFITLLVFWLIGEKDVVFEKNDSFWAKDMKPANAALNRNIEVDVAIIGGGYTGLSAAYHLMKYNPALNVVVLEAKQVGSGASGRHGGMILPQPPTESFEIASEKKVHKKTYELTSQSMKAMEKMCEESGVDCDLKLHGFVHTIIDEDDIPYYQDYVEEANDLDIPLEFWDADETEEMLGTDYYAASVYDPNGGSVHAIKLVNALKVMAEKAGAVIYENSKVNAISEGKTIVLKVGDENHEVKAKDVVLAANAFISKLGYFKYTIVPVHAQTAVTEPLTDKQIKDIAWESRLPFYDSNNYLFHMVLRDDNRIVIGGGNADYHFRGDLHYKGDMQKIYELTINELIKVYPSLKGIKLEYVWDGVLGMTSDEIPLVGVTGKYNNIYYGLAYNGQGVNMSFMFGDVIASVYSGKTHGWEETPYFSYQSGMLGLIPPEPFRWLGAKTLMEYYRRQDNEMTDE